MKVGDYVRINRANRTYIRKTISLYDINVKREKQKLLILDKSFEGCRYSVRENKVLKSSPNIIDLIEVGDYVNGCYVTNRQASHNEGIAIIPKRIGIIKCNAYFNQGNYNDCDFKWIEEKDIKSIVTKEQFKAMEYKCE